jgi:hypothetical protein
VFAMSRAEGKTNTSSGGGSYFSTIFGSSLDHTNSATKSEKSSSKNEMNPNDIPKDELLQLCMKLNKRMQTLETKHSELVQKYKVVSQERNSLFDILRSSFTNPPESVEDVSSLAEIWTHHQEEERIHIRKLEEEIKSLKLSQSDVSHSEPSQSPEVNFFHSLSMLILISLLNFKELFKSSKKPTLNLKKLITLRRI